MSFNIDIKASIDNLRVSKIKLGRTEIQTPYCGFTHTELEKFKDGADFLKSQIPRKQIHEVIIDFGSDETFNNRLNNEKKKIHILRRMKYLSKDDQENICHFRLSPGIRISALQLCNIVAMQTHSKGFSVITLPDPIREMSNNWIGSMDIALSEANDAIETGYGFTIMPTISLEQPNKIVEAKIEWLLEHGISAIGLRAHGTYFPQRLYKAINLLNQNEEPIWIHLYDLNKKFLNVSQVHLAPLAGVDTICTKKRYSYVEKPRKDDKGDFPTPEKVRIELTEKEMERKKRVSQQDLFESKALGFFSEEERPMKLGHELYCNCPLCQKTRGWDDFVNFLEQYDRKSLLQVHEYHGFSSELQMIQKSITENDLSSYYYTKSLIIEQRDKILERYPTFERIR